MKTRHQLMLEQVLNYLIAGNHGKARKLLKTYLEEKIETA